MRWLGKEQVNLLTILELFDKLKLDKPIKHMYCLKEWGYMGWSKQVERNLKAMEYEEAGNLEEAIKLYEINVKEEFDGTHPYQRLSEIYLKLDRNKDLIRVLEKAIYVFEHTDIADCQDKTNQLQRFKQIYNNIQKDLDKVK